MKLRLGHVATGLVFRQARLGYYDDDEGDRVVVSFVEHLHSGCVSSRRDRLANVTSLAHERRKRAHPEFRRPMGIGWLPTPGAQWTRTGRKWSPPCGKDSTRREEGAVEPGIVPFICAKCGGAFSPREGGLCAVCHRPFCRRHLGVAHAVVRAAKKHEPVKPRCEECRAKEREAST